MCKTADGRYRFNFLEMVCSGRSGETSATGFCGVMLTLLSTIVIIALLVFYFCNSKEAGNILNFLDKIVIVLGIGAALLGTRKISGAIASTKGANIVNLVEKTLADRDGRKSCSDCSKSPENTQNEAC